MADNGSDSDNNSRNPDTATTEGFTDPECLSDASSHGTEADFLENFKCHQCDVWPPYEECIQFAPRRAAGECPPISVIMPAPQSLPKHFLYRGDCQHFVHVNCVFLHDDQREIKSCAAVAIAVIEGNIGSGHFKCAACHDADGDNW